MPIRERAARATCACFATGAIKRFESRGSSSSLGNDAILRKEGDALIVEPVRRKSLLALLASWKPLDETFPDVDEKLRPLDDVRL